MTAEPPPRSVPVRVPLAHLREDQLRLVHSVLRASELPAVRSGTDIVVAAHAAAAVQDAVRWVLAADGPPPDEEHDPTLSRGLGPVVPPSRPPLPDGRRQATRYRRLAAGTMDVALAGVPVLLVWRWHEDPALALAVHGVYHTLPPLLFGWTLGKLWTGLRVVEQRTLRNPRPARALLRWAVLGLPFFAAIMLGASADLVLSATLLAPLPVVWDLRGVHDRAAGTIVVERSPTGPGLWVRRSRRPVPS